MYLSHKPVIHCQSTTQKKVTGITPIHRTNMNHLFHIHFGFSDVQDVLQFFRSNKDLCPFLVQEIQCLPIRLCIPFNSDIFASHLPLYKKTEIMRHDKKCKCAGITHIAEGGLQSASIAWRIQP